MRKNRILIALMPFFYLMTLPLLAHAATITACTFDKESYYPGQTGYVAVTVYNNKESTIRVFELSATIDYYYNDDNVYLQTFFTILEPSIEIQQGQSDTFYVDFSLPTNIAPGYTTLLVKAKTEIWIDEAQRWLGSDHPTYEPTLYVESPYKQQFEEQQATNQQLQGQLQEQEAINEQATNTIYVLGATTLIFAAVTGFLFMLLRKARILTQPTS